jgi:hypothetical protein
MNISKEELSGKSYIFSLFSFYDLKILAVKHRLREICGDRYITGSGNVKHFKEIIQQYPQLLNVVRVYSFLNFFS